jgi:hypothetical protein
MSNLPPLEQNPDKETRLFFDTYFTKPLTYPSNELDATVGFFESRGFDTVAARSIGVTLLQQAKVDGLKIFELLDKIKNLSNPQIYAGVLEILNYDRERTSVLGYKLSKVYDNYEIRNILP